MQNVAGFGPQSIGKNDKNTFDNVPGVSPEAAKTFGYSDASVVGETKKSAKQSLKKDFRIPASTKAEIQRQEITLTEARAELNTKEMEVVQTKETQKSSWKSLKFWDKFFRWIPLFHDRNKIRTWKAAKKAAKFAVGARDQQKKVVRGLDQNIDTYIAGFLMTAKGSNYAELDASHQHADQMLDALSNARRAVRRAISETESAVSTKQWDVMRDMQEQNRPNSQGGSTGPFGRSDWDWNDSWSASQRSDARVAIAEARGVVSSLPALLANYKGQVTGSVGSLAGVSIGGAFWDYFGGDNAWFGFWQISDMQRAIHKMIEIKTQIDMIHDQVSSHVEGFAAQMKRQVSAVRTACKPS